jgi:hypothetical protein
MWLLMAGHGFKQNRAPLYKGEPPANHPGVRQIPFGTTGALSGLCAGDYPNRGTYAINGLITLMSSAPAVHPIFVHREATKRAIK